MFNPAIRMFNESIKHKGEHSAEAYYQLGRAYHLKSQYFIQQLEQEPEGFKARKRLRVLIDKRITKALDAFQASLAEDPYFSLPYYWMGLTHLLKDECVCDEAFSLIQIAVTLDPKTIYRYLKDYPLTCRSRNVSCHQSKLILGVKELLGKTRPSPQES
jgi:tetratricopeptide (TPR) repeat protein